MLSKIVPTAPGAVAEEALLAVIEASARERLDVLSGIAARLGRIESALGLDPRADVAAPAWLERARLYTVKELAGHLGVSRTAVYTAVDRGRLKAAPGPTPSAVRFRGEDVLAWLRTKRPPRGTSARARRPETAAAAPVDSEREARVRELEARYAGVRS